MSYCRIGPDSDIYLIRDIRGRWEIAVAWTRLENKSEKCPQIETDEQGKPTDKGRDSLLNWLNFTKTPIGLSADGKSFWCVTRKEVIDKLDELKGMGYRVPDRAYERLRREIAERT